MERKILFTILVFLFFSNQKTFALDLNVIVTNETCTGNGLLAFSVTNQTSGVPVFYAIYLLPNTTTPIATISNTTYSALIAGDYSIVATQTVNGVVTSIVINETLLPVLISPIFIVPGLAGVSVYSNDLASVEALSWLLVSTHIAPS